MEIATQKFTGVGTRFGGINKQVKVSTLNFTRYKRINLNNDMSIFITWS